MRKQKGFSLIELLIVVAIILIIAAIAIPNLLKSKISANEASAVGSTRTLITSEITFSTSNSGTFATLKELGPIASGGVADLIDATLASKIKSGYNFDALGTPSAFTITAWPVTAGTTGNRCFCGGEDGTIHQEGSTAATCSAATATDNATCSALTPV